MRCGPRGRAPHQASHRERRYGGVWRRPREVEAEEHASHDDDVPGDGAVLRAQETLRTLANGRGNKPAKRTASGESSTEGWAAAHTRHLLGASVAGQRLARQPEGEDKHAHRHQDYDPHRAQVARHVWRLVTTLASLEDVKYLRKFLKIPKR